MERDCIVEPIEKRGSCFIDDKSGYILKSTDILTCEEEKKLFGELQLRKKTLLGLFIRSDFVLQKLVETYHKNGFSFRSLFVSREKKGFVGSNYLSCINQVSIFIEKNGDDFSKLSTLSDNEREELLSVIRERTEEAVNCLENLGVRAIILFDQERTTLLNFYEEIKLYKNSDEKTPEQIERIKKIEELFHLPIYEVENYLRSFETLSNAYLEKRNKIVTSHMRMAFSVALKYKENDTDLLDYIQEGNLALIKAINYFEYSLNRSRFSTYAYKVLHHTCKALKFSKIFKRSIFISYQGDIKKVTRSYKNLQKKLQREPSFEEVSQDVGISVENVRKLLSFKKKVRSIEDLSNSRGGDFVDTVLNKEGDIHGYSEESNQKEIQQILEQAMDIVDSKIISKSLKKGDKPRDLFISFFGLFGETKMTLSELREQYGLRFNQTVHVMVYSYREKLKEALLKFDYSTRLVDLLTWIDEKLEENLPDDDKSR